MNTTAQNTLKEKWDALKEEQPKLRIRNAAELLQVSEAELLATKINEGVTRLEPKFAEILQEIESLGKVMGLTRNEECVHERKGTYLNADFSSPHAQLFVGDDIDMRIFLTHWKFAFAVEEGERKSLQFFGKDGMAIHKIYLTKTSNEEAYTNLVEKYKSIAQDALVDTEEVAPKPIETPDNEIDVKSFQEDWVNLKDTHNFFGMLRKYKLNRLQALRLAPNETLAKKIDNKKVVSLLEEAAKRKLPIMVFVGNRGNIQIHTGAIKKTMWHNTWINVLDPDFNLHLNTDKIAETWVVRKPTEDGDVTAVEVFNKEGDIIVQFFGKRKPGIPELESWRELVKDLEA
ncbi:putative hemin transport protein [Mesonia hippocampi]|uniref:Putative hemin transport protein n=1 Tax=Mesonia hippocampi TaxID=1628250 RepID=A0A840EXP8_9FLAO|nr:ChuX/HutX family heme-like substrate-binding protein [Mesonia hippocampi]MBB4118834.1 putative hemin transport protein [Mesonia hippocampi]